MCMYVIDETKLNLIDVKDLRNHSKVFPIP